MFYIDYLDVDPILWPEVEPFNQGYLKVSRLHSLWYAEFGNPEGVPVIILHGGPGFGCRGNEMRYFDTNYYRLILLDQRGCGKSFPLYEIRDNTTWHLVDDLERLRQHLNINKWVVFGGSWGATLGMAYGQSYPHRVLGFLLRAAFIGETNNWQQLWYNMKYSFPDVWEEFCNFLPPEEREDVFLGYYRRLMSENKDELTQAAAAFIRYDMICSLYNHSQAYVDFMLKNIVISISTAKFFAYYTMNNFFLKPGQILNNIQNIEHLPCIILHGRYDQLCLPISSFKLHRAWPGSILKFIEDAAHSAIEPGMTKALLDATHYLQKLNLG